MMDNLWFGPRGMFTNAVGRGDFPELKTEARVTSALTALSALVIVFVLLMMVLA